MTLDRTRSCLIVLALLAELFCPQSALAQPPEVNYVFPSGAKAGTTVEVELVGKQVAEVTGLYFSRSGLKATAADKGKMAISIPADAEPGDCDVWAVSPKGLSVPCRLAISDLPEQSEKEPNNLPPEAQTIELPAVVHGRITPGPDADWYKIRLAAGDALTMECQSTSLGGKVWPTLTVLDPAGREIIHDTLTRLEPCLHRRATIPGDYLVRVEDRAYRQTAAPFYRLIMTTGPWIVSAFPSALEQGKSQPVTLYGYHLSGGQPVASSSDGLEQLEVSIAAPAPGQLLRSGWKLTRAIQLDSFEYRHPGAQGIVRFELLDRPLQRVAAPSPVSPPLDPLLVTPPVELIGRFDSPRHVVDWFRFNAKAKQVFWIEGVADRLARPCDLEILIHNKSGAVIETLTDVVLGKGQSATVPMETRDPSGSWKAPAEGEYRIAIRDLLNAPAQSAERAYRLSIGPRLEDVRMVAMLEEGSSPRGVAVAAGKSVTVTLTAIRRNGHEGKIDIRAEDLPEGMRVASITLAAKETSGKLVIEAAQDAAPWVGPLRLIATSEVNGKPHEFSVEMAMPLVGAIPAAARLCEEFVVAIVR